MEQTFKERHAREILKRVWRADKDFTIKEDGVWPAAVFDETDDEGSNFGQWRPTQVFADDSLPPDVAGTPMLPFPFTARHLAAFMVGGVGAAVAGHYGDWEDGPDPDRLNEMPQSENFARLAVKGAFDAYREAKKAVGACPLALEAEADRARKAYQLANRAANIREGVSDSIPGTDDSSDRRARAVASIAKQDAEMEATALAWKQGYEAWLNAMVRQLLQPAPEQTPATPAPVVAVKPASDAPAIPKNQRPDLLTPLIEKAQRNEPDPFNAAVIWPKLCDMAESKTRPLIGATADGIKWIDGNDDVQFTTKKALSDRLRRQKNAR